MGVRCWRSREADRFERSNYPRNQNGLEFAMNQQPRIPDAEIRKRHVEKMREVCRQLDIFNLKLDEAIAIFEADNRRQRQERFAGKYRRAESQVVE